MAQKNTGGIKGILVDSALKQDLAGASISVIQMKDSSVAGFTTSDKKGAFLVSIAEQGNYDLIISMQGYLAWRRQFSIGPDKKMTDLGTVILKKDFRTLDTFTVVSETPILIKGDTVQFNASAFKTVPNATAEDLMKKLPGVEVDADGNVKAQGEEVKKIYVDGKEFFGKDPKMATKNITAEMIQSVQVYDDMSDQAKFTRVDDGSRSKIINIVLKKNRRKGTFGRALAGYGTDDRYQSSLSFNRFNEARRFTLIGSSNNINKQAFVSSDIVTRMGGFNGYRGGARGGGGGGNGLSTASSLGMNYTDKIKTKVDLTGSYNFTQTRNKREQTSFRSSNFFNDSTAEESSVNTGISSNSNQAFTLRLEYYIDSLNSILYTPNVSLQHNENSSEDSSFTMAQKTNSKYLANTNSSRYNSVRNGSSINNELLYRRRFRKPGRTFTLGISSGIDHSTGSGYNLSPIVFYNADGSINKTIDQNFESTQLTRSNSTVVTSSFTELLGKGKILELNYAYTDRHSVSDKDAYDYNSQSKQFDIINKQQTNYFENDFIAHRYGGNFRFFKQLYNFQVGTSVQTSEQSNNSKRGIYQQNGKDSVIHTSQRYTNLFPTANFMYNFSKKTNIRLYYRGRSNQPSTNQLQDVPDLTNLLRISVGNPSLKQEFSHSMDIFFKTMNTTTYKYLDVSVSASQTHNRIVNSIDSLTSATLKGLGLPDSLMRPGVQLLRPLNLNGAYNVNSTITVGLPFKKLKGSSVNFTNSMNMNRGLSMLYKQLTSTNSFTVSQSAGVNLDLKNKFNFGLRARVSYTKTRYSANLAKNDITYFNQSYSTDINYYITKSLIISTDFDYMIYSGQSAGYNRNVPLWNANIAKQFFKKKNGELRFSVNDLLNQNQSITRSQGENYYYDSRSVVLKRYFLLTFSYNLNRFGGRAAAQQGNNGQPGNNRNRGTGGNRKNF